MIIKRKFAINIAIAISTIAMAVPLMAEPWALSTADSDYWSEQQRSRKNLKRIRGLFERLKTSEEGQEEQSRQTPVSSERAAYDSASTPKSEDQWSQDQYVNPRVSSRKNMPHYLGSQGELQRSDEFFVFGQDDPSVLLPSARQVVEDNVAMSTPRSLSIQEESANNRVVDQQIGTEMYVSEGQVEEIGSISSNNLTNDDEVMEYVVRPGDSLRQIARKIYQEPKRFTEIMQWNNLPNHNIFPGQKLKLERVTKKQREDFHLALEQEQRNLFPAQLYKYKVHKVRNGDSLARISKMYLGSQKHYAQLARLNELDSRRYLKIGQKLIVPIRKQD